MCAGLTCGILAAATHGQREPWTGCLVVRLIVCWRMIGDLCDLQPVTPGNVITMAEIQSDHVDSILSQFSELTDPRSHVNRIDVFGD